jgi:DMSO/TMAO reductase YedYZ heme-binding membrane subunit
LPTAGTARPRRGRWILVAAAIAAACGAAVARGTATDRAILAAVQRFALSYSGVFSLIALTAAVAAGLVATDRIVMTPAGRVTSQAVHRALSLAAVGFLATHVLTEVLAHRSRPVDMVAPFLASGRTLYLGLGTLASDLLLLILATGVARRRFAGWPAIWRALHVTAYLAWPLAIVHGLLAGRHAKPYVDWSYGRRWPRTRSPSRPLFQPGTERPPERLVPPSRPSRCPASRSTGGPRGGTASNVPRGRGYVGHRARGSLHRAAAPHRRS